MAAAVTNPFKLTWGTYEIGGTTERLIVGLHRLRSDFQAFEVTLDVLIRGTSDSAFASACSELESEFTKRRNLILFQVGSSTIHTFNPSSSVNTGLNSYARIEKVGTPGADTDRSRLYTVTVGCEKPATDASGRRDATITVEYDAARIRTVTISGVWTAVTSNNATAQYAAQIDSYCSSALSALLPSATFETSSSPVMERTERDDQDKVIRFTRVFREVIKNQSSASLDDTTIKAAMLGWSRSKTQPGDSGGGRVKRLEQIVARFECALDKTQTTDVGAFYRSTVRPFIVSTFESRYAPVQYAIVQEDHGTGDDYRNTLVATMIFRAAIDPTDVIESVQTARIVEDGGKVFTGRWNGRLFSKYADQGIASRRRIGLRAVRVLGSLGPKARVGSGEGSVFGVAFVNPDGSAAAGTLVPGAGVPAGGLGAALGQPGQAGLNGGGGGGGSWHLISNDSAATVKTEGQPDGSQITYTDIVETTVEEYVAD